MQGVREVGAKAVDFHRLDVRGGALHEKIHEQLLHEFTCRMEWRGNRSAVIPGQELAGMGRASVATALRHSQSFLLSNLVLVDSIACVYVDGVGKAYVTAEDFDAAVVEAVEVYGMRAELSNTLSSRAPNLPNWCGRGAQGPKGSALKTGLQRAGVNSGRQPTDNYVRAVAIWLKHRP